MPFVTETPLMSDLIQKVRNLPDAQAKAVLLSLCRQAFTTWTQWIEDGPNLVYFESVVGTRQTIDPGLPQEALASVVANSDGQALRQRYLEPLAALQDEDVNWDARVEFAYYAIYNLFRKYTLKEEVDPWLIANQALSSLPIEADLRSVLTRAIEEAES